MLRRITFRILTVCAIIASPLLLVGCEGTEEDPIETGAEALEEGAEATKEAAEETAEEIGDEIDDATSN